MVPDTETPKSPYEGEAHLPNRDGTSQAARIQSALNPDYAAVDERSLKDVLIFAREYAKELRYFGVQNEEVVAQVDWSAFLSSDDDLDEIIAFMEDPGKVPADRAQRYSRPHFALFLTFLQLLRHAQTQLNTLTRRHLDFYYQQVLRMTKRLAVPDQVNVLVDLGANTPEFELPTGTLLRAGSDSLGQPLYYSTDDPIVVNQAKIARLSSINVENRSTGLREVKANFTGMKALLAMLGMALGDPTNTYTLPKFPHWALVTPPPLYPLPDDPSGVSLDVDSLAELRDLVTFSTDTRNGLAMGFGDLRNLMSYKGKRDQSERNDWENIYAILKRIADKGGFTFTPPDHDFATNFIDSLQSALGYPPEFKTAFDGVPQVSNIYQAFDLINRRDIQQAIYDAITDKMHMTVEDFIAVMKLKKHVDDRWEDINDILARAGEIKGKSLEKFPYHDQSAFEQNLADALGLEKYPQFTYPTNPEPIQTLDDYYVALRLVEHYFHMTAENFAILTTIISMASVSASDDHWQKVYDILEDSHREKVYEQRRQEHRHLLTGATPAMAYAAMVSAALGVETANEVDDELLEWLTRFIASASDRAFLKDTRDQVRTGGNSVDWDRAIRLLEGVERVRMPVPAPQKIEWLNLYASADATTVTASTGGTGDKEQIRWKTFGRGQPSVASSSPPPPEFGWAISSPILQLSQGQRTVALTLIFNAAEFHKDDILHKFPDYNAASGALRIEISTAKGWIKPDVVTVQAVDNPLANPTADNMGLQFILSFGEKVAAIAALANTDELVGAWPVLRLMLRQTWEPGIGSMGRYVTDYPIFRDLELLAVGLDVAVNELTPLLIQSDDAILKAAKPSEPFGSRPAAGSHFFLGHPELSSKKIDTLKFNFEWMKIPDSFFDYYANYPSIHDVTDFTISVSLVDYRIEFLIDKKVQLFDPPFEFPGSGNSTPLPDDLTLDYIRQNFHAGILSSQPVFTTIITGKKWTLVDGSKTYIILKKWDEKAFQAWVKPAAYTTVVSLTDLSGKIGAGFVYDRIEEPALGDDLQDWSRYFQWELNAPDFQHETYPALAIQKSIDLAAFLTNKVGSTDMNSYKVNPPYTPKIKYLSVDYTSSIQIMMAQYQPGAQPDRIFHIQPFGYNEVFLEAGKLHYSFLPRYTAEGSLYIGISSLRPPQNVSLLFQMAEGSADPDFEPEPVQWSYLNNNRWIGLNDGQMVRDTTNSLINSGIIVFSLVAVQSSSILPSNLYWLRAEIARNSSSVCDTVAIDTQAISATFVDQGNALDHLSQPLPEGSISRLATPVPQISGIRQPYTSFGGKLAEQENTFYLRISERLRHKQRALTAWDYERLILERFPEIYKAKCLPANADNPGSVVVIVIPDIKNKLPFNPFEPKAPTDLIVAVEAYLRDLMPAFAAVKVKNAHYVTIKVRVDVRFRPGYNEGYYTQRLNEELNHFLSPWAYEADADIVIGGRIYANAIINFIETREYVDFAANIELFSSTDDLKPKRSWPTDADGLFVGTDSADQVLVAVRKHEIGMLSDMRFQETLFTGIGYMKVELDFVVG